MGGGPETVSGAGKGELVGLTEFPEDGGGTAGPSVDISGLAAAISRPLAAGNGDYSVQVSLHPPELGEVRALLSLQGDVLHVTLTPEHAGGYEALSDSLPALSEQLGGTGVEVNVTLGHPGEPPTGEDGGRDDSAGSGTTPFASAEAVDAPTALPDRAGGQGRIHLIL
jgi:hypothetical protein